jgi:hypothetical protein
LLLKQHGRKISVFVMSLPNIEDISLMLPQTTGGGDGGDDGGGGEEE